MTVKKKKLKKSVRRILVLLIGLLAAAIITGIGMLLFNEEGNQYTSYTAQNIIEKIEDADIRLSYPEFGYESFDKQLKEDIDVQKQQFLKELKEAKTTQPLLQGEMITDYDVYKTESLLCVRLSFAKYLGGANYLQENKTYYYDIGQNRMIAWEDLFEDETIALNRLSTLALEQLKSMDIILWEDESLKLGLSCKKENFEHIYLSEGGMDILFPVYQVGPHSSGNIWVHLDYAAVNDILKKEYRGTSVMIETVQEKEASKRDTRDLSSLEGKKLVALTFDDGPSYGITEQLLDGLKSRDAKVTFFVLGSRAEQYKDIVQRAYLDGHTIGSHSYEHKNLLNLNEQDLTADLKKTNDAIFNATGSLPFALRPPYGNYDQGIIDNAGMPIVIWNIDTEDWKNRDAQITYQNILDHIDDGSIVLLHDLYGTSVEAALQLIDDLSDQGYAFVSLEELAQLGRLEADAGNVYSSFK